MKIPFLLYWNLLESKSIRHASKRFKEVCAKKVSRTPYRDASLDFADSNVIIWNYAKDACIGIECMTEAEEREADNSNRVLDSTGKDSIHSPKLNKEVLER